MGSVKTKWDDRAFQRELDTRIVKLLKRLAIRGESIAKQVISGEFLPALKAVDTGRLRASLTHEVFPDQLLVRIGTNVNYAIFVFIGTAKMIARPVLRVMLSILQMEQRR